MKKIIIRDFLNDSGLAVTLVSRCLKTARKDLTDSLFVFSADKKVIVAVEKNKESLRFDVYEEKN